MSAPRVSVILPVHNQADHLERVLGEYVEALSHLAHPAEALLVVNGCRDGSLEICERLAAAHPMLRVIASEKAGWGAAVKRGIREARGETLCYANLARTRAQDVCLILLYALANPTSAVKANRKIRERFHRWIGSFLYNVQCRMLFDLYSWDVNGTPKAFSRCHAGLFELESDDDLIDLEFNVVCRRQNYPVLDVPIFFSSRRSGKSTTNLRSAFRLYWGAFLLWAGKNKAASYAPAQV